MRSVLTQDLTHPRAERLLAQALAASPERLDLAALAIAALEFPGLDVADWQAQLDFLASRVRACVGESAGVAEQYTALRKVLVEEEGFRGNAAHYADPDNSFLNLVLTRKVGIPISLSVVWLEVARRAEIPLYGVAFPGHFLVALSGDGTRIVVDPFNRGRTLSSEDLNAMLRRTAANVLLTDELFEPASVRAISWRMLMNLKRLYINKSDQPRAVKVENLLLQLAPNHPAELRARAALLSSLGAYGAALKDLERAIEIGRAPDVPALVEAAKVLRQRLQYLN